MISSLQYTLTWAIFTPQKRPMKLEAVIWATLPTSDAGWALPRGFSLTYIEFKFLNVLDFKKKSTNAYEQFFMTLKKLKLEIYFTKPNN